MSRRNISPQDAPRSEFQKFNNLGRIIEVNFESQWFWIKNAAEDLRNQLHVFFISNTLISNTRLKLAENQANGKEHPEAELLIYENYSHSSSTLSSKNNKTYSKKYTKEEVCLYSWDYLINHNENEDENEK